MSSLLERLAKLHKIQNGDIEEFRKDQAKAMVEQSRKTRCIYCAYSKLGFMECWCTYGGNEKFCPPEDSCEYFKLRE